jgi:hypothetical protein
MRDDHDGFAGNRLRSGETLNRLPGQPADHHQQEDGVE